jgi:hypothetical protein
VNAPLDENGYQQWQPQPQPQLQPQPPQQSGLRYLWNHPVVIAGVMGMLLLLVTAISIVAIKAVGSDPAGKDTAGDGREPNGQQTTGLPAAGPTNANTGTPVNPPAQSSTGGSTPAVNTSGAVFLSGKLTLSYYDSGVDFDTAKKSSLGTGEKYDFEIDDTALTGVNRGQAGTGAAAGAPTPAGCSAASVKWAGSAHISVLADGAVVCVKTSDDRLAAFTVSKLTKSDDGQIRNLEIDYVVWKKTGDA